jgi:hypothetical protein
MTATKEKLVTVTIKNSFHGTEAKVRVPESWVDSEYSILTHLQDAASVEIANFRNGPNRAKLNRVKRALCGVSGCQCGIERY